MRVCVWQKSFWVRKAVSKARPRQAETLASLRKYVPGRKTQKFSAQEENRKRIVRACAHGHVCGQMNASLSLCPFLQRKIYMVIGHKGKCIPSHTCTRRNVLSSLTNRASLEKHTLSSPERGLMCVSLGRDLPLKVSLKVSVMSRNTHVHMPHTTSGWSGSAMTCVRVCVCTRVCRTRLSLSWLASFSESTNAGKASSVIITRAHRALSPSWAAPRVGGVSGFSRRMGPGTCPWVRSDRQAMARPQDPGRTRLAPPRAPLSLSCSAPARPPH